MDVFSGLSCLREVRCLASIPFPLTPTLSPRRGSRALRSQVETTSMWQGLATVLPLLGERVGVRGNGIDARQRTARRQLDPLKNVEAAPSLSRPAQPFGRAPAEQHERREDPPVTS